jgi:hypothetical protein
MQLREPINTFETRQESTNKIRVKMNSGDASCWRKVCWLRMTHRGLEDGSGRWPNCPARAEDGEDDMRFSPSSAAAAGSASFAKCYSFSQREGCVRTYALMLQRIGFLIEELECHHFLNV